MYCYFYCCSLHKDFGQKYSTDVMLCKKWKIALPGEIKSVVFPFNYIKKYLYLKNASAFLHYAAVVGHGSHLQEMHNDMQFLF